MTLQELNESYGVPGVLEFSATEAGLLRAQVTLPSCTAELYLHGAHLTQWQPTGGAPVLFLSERSAFAEGKAIRGGVPVIFPWFGPRTANPLSARTDGPMHGFARTAAWEVAFAAVAGEELHITLRLGPSEETAALGYGAFQAVYSLVLGRELKLRLTVANQGDAPMYFEEALHSYFVVGDCAQIRIAGLGNTEYLDKLDGYQRKLQAEDVLVLTGATDRPYLNTPTTVTVEDALMSRRIVVEKSSSATTVVWNPWAELSAGLHDLGGDDWKGFVCVETANAGENGVTLPPQQAHSMEARVRVEGL